MKVTDKGSLEANLSQPVKNNRAVASVQKKEGKSIKRANEAAQVNISADARRLHKVAALAKRENELRTEKVNRIKEQISQGKYQVEATEVAKGVVRSEVSRLLGGRNK